jgi:DNA-binding transcriptional MerR regulator
MEIKMKRLLNAVALLLVNAVAMQALLAQSVDDRIAGAVLPLPDDLKADATVFEYDPDTGERIVLRQGSNHVECQTRNPETGFTLCFGVADAARRDLTAKLRAQGMSDDEVDEALAAAEAQGRVEPAPFGSLLYRYYDKDDRIQLLWVVRLPNATSEQLGMPTASQRDNSLAGHGLPWMMREGTPQAHLMIPINGTELSNSGGVNSRLDSRSIGDPITQASLPLPEELRAGAAVVQFDPDTGERRVLRQGTNMIECQPRNPETGFTRCYHEIQSAERALMAKLSAEGESAEEMGAAVAAARAAGTLPPATFGALDYRFYDEDDRLRLLWILRLPNATSEQLGMPTGSQRDNSLAGRGLPWMMREGTPQAHLMIPINSTELSNQPR